MAKIDFSHLTDSYAADLASKTLYDYNDHANFYVYAYTHWNISNFTDKGYYKEVGPQGDWVSSIVAIGEETICFCLLNAMNGEPVRQIVIPFVLLEKNIYIYESSFESEITLFFNGDDVIKVTIPRFSTGTPLKHQDGMRKRICDALEKMNRIRNKK